MITKTLIRKGKLTFDRTRPLSWSAISSFEWNKEQWYRKYVLGEKETSAEMIFGSMVDKKIQNDSTFLPSLPRYTHMQHNLKVRFAGIPLVGIPDGICFKDLLLADYKTGKKAWDQKRADETGQLTMYLLLVYLQKRINPSRFKNLIHWMPTMQDEDFNISFVPDIEKKILTFETKRTMRDILQFGERIKKTYQEMIQYCKNYD